MSDSTPSASTVHAVRGRLLSRIGRRLAGLALAALLLAGFHSLGWLTATLDTTGREHLLAADHAYLKETSAAARESFITLTALQGGLHLVQSGSAGFSFIVDIEARLGDLLTPLVTMVDRAVEISMASMAASEALALLLDAAEAVAEPLLGALLLLLALFALARIVTEAPNPVSRFAAEASELMLVLFLLLYLALPLAIYGASQLSQSFTAPLSGQAHGHFSALNDHLNGDAKHDNLKGKVHGVMNRYESFSVKVDHKNHATGEALKRHLVVFVLDVIVFPLGLLWLFYLVVRMVARHLLGPVHSVEVVMADRDH